MADPAIPTGPMTVEAFLNWADEEVPVGKWELVEGVPQPKRIVDMAPELRRHARAKGRAFSAIADAIDGSANERETFVDGIGVHIEDRSVHIPDIVVECGERLDDDRLVRFPVILVEVISPSIRARDTGAKLIGYFTIPSVTHSLLVSPEKGRIVHHRRDGDGIATTILGQDGVADLAPPGIRLAVSYVLPPGT